MTLLLVSALVAVALAEGDSGQRLPVVAVEVLNRFVGEWDTETWIRHEGPAVRESRTKGRAVCRRTLGGRYVEFRTSSIPPGQSDLQIMTYDTRIGRYRQWLFDADGYRHEAEGRWDPVTSTLRWQGQVDGMAFVIDDRWISSHRLEWTLTRTGPDGRRLQTIRGVLTRLR